MPDTIEYIKELIPSGAGAVSTGSSILYWIVVIVFIVLFAAIMITIAVVIVIRMRFNKKIVIYDKINGRWERTGKDRATELKYGTAGDTVFLLRKRKKYLPRPEEQTGRKEYWFGIRGDGEWVNIGIEDIDFAMKKLKVRFVHPEARYARTALHKGIRERYEKKSFMEKYGQMIQMGISIVAITIILIFLYLNLDKMYSGAPAVDKMVKSAEESLTKLLGKEEQLLNAMDNICVKKDVSLGGTGG